MRKDPRGYQMAQMRSKIALLTRENENLRQIERNVQGAREHEYQRAERALAEVASLTEQVKRALDGWDRSQGKQIAAIGRAEKAEAELARLREQMKDREYD